MEDKKSIEPDLKELFELCRNSNNESAARKLFEVIRWGNNPVCPHCRHNEGNYRYKSGKLFKCSSCKKQFTVTVGTIFEKSHLPLITWFKIIFYFLESKRGISSHQLARFVNIQQKTAWFALQKIRYSLSNDGILEKMKGIIEVDETFIGGKNKNRHFKDRIKFTQGRSAFSKSIVFGMLERNKGVRAFVVRDTSAYTLQRLIWSHVLLRSTIISDSWRGYSGLSSKYEHVVINHDADFYGIGILHTNTIEGFWSFLKRGLGSTYNHVSKFYLQNYVNEFAFRYNNRAKKFIENFDALIKIIGGSITYKEVYNKSRKNYALGLS